MTTEQKIIKNKVGLLELARQLGNVSQACKILGYSRDSFYRFQELYETGGEEALREISKRKPIVKNRVAPEIEEAVVQLALEQPTWGQVRVSNELRKKSLFISPGGVRSVWLCHDLQTFKLRLKALEAKVAQDGLILTEGQIIALEKAKDAKEAHGEIETEHPGYLGCPGYLLRRYAQGCRSHLPADLHRYLLQGRFSQAPRPKERPGRRRYAQRPGAAVQASIKAMRLQHPVQSHVGHSS